MPVDTRQHLASRIGRLIVRAGPKAVRSASTTDRKALVEMAAEGVLQIWAAMEGAAGSAPADVTSGETGAEPKTKGRKSSTKRGEA